MKEPTPKDTEAILEAAVLGHARHSYELAPALMLRSVTAAHVVMGDGSEAVITTTTGDPDGWQMLGLIGHADTELRGEMVAESCSGVLAEEAGTAAVDAVRDFLRRREDGEA